MAEAENKEDPLGFQEGQRILSRIEVLCHKFRQTVGTVVKQVKQDEYEIAIREVTEAQRNIDKRRMDELSRLAETQSRPLTALEKVRLQHLQKMEEAEKKDAEKKDAEKKESELLTTPFTALLDREIGGKPISGLDVETVLEDLMSPFVSGVLLEVENLYAANQQMIQLAARCRSEAVHFQKRVKELNAEVDVLTKEVRENEDKIVRLQNGVRERTDQLEGIRAAHYKEVIAVKEQAIENLKDKHGSIEDALIRGGRGFDPHLLNKLGADADGRDLDKALQDFLEDQQRPASPIRDGGTTPGSQMSPVASARMGSGGEHKDGFEHSLRLMRLENEMTQMRFQLHLVRHGMESWRDQATEASRSAAVLQQELESWQSRAMEAERAAAAAAPKALAASEASGT